MRRVGGFVLSHQNLGHLGCNPAKRLICGVYDVPLSLHLFFGGHIGAVTQHGISSFKSFFYNSGGSLIYVKIISSSTNEKRFPGETWLGSPKAHLFIEEGAIWTKIPYFRLKPEIRFTPRASAADCPFVRAVCRASLPARRQSP